MKDNNYKRVAVSGYFTALHKGHVLLFEKAAQLGDWLIVIVNNNQQQIAKKGRLVHPAEDIKYILETLCMVDEVVIAEDSDGSVCETLKTVKPDFFCNGGDRLKSNIPEAKTCEDLGIEMVFNVGGEKMNSSSNILMGV